MTGIHFPSSTAEFLQHRSALLHMRQKVTPHELATEYCNIKECLLQVIIDTLICTQSLV